MSQLALKVCPTAGPRREAERARRLRAVYGDEPRKRSIAMQDVALVSLPLAKP